MEKNNEKEKDRAFNLYLLNIILLVWKSRNMGQYSRATKSGIRVTTPCLLVVEVREHIFISCLHTELPPSKLLSAYYASLGPLSCLSAAETHSSACGINTEKG